MLLLTVTAAWAGDGDGTKDHPFSGVWQASELASRIVDKGKDIYLAYDCDIKNGTITVIDSKLNNKQIARNWDAWSPGTVLGSSNYSGYDEYYKANSLYERRSQLFIITQASVSGSSSITMTGYFSGRYNLSNIVLPRKEVGGVEYYVIKTADDYETFRNIVATGNPYANAVLEANITVTKPIGGGGPQFHYRGTFDGQEHTITLAMTNTTTEPYGLFQYTEPGCIIRNLKVSGKIDTNSTYFGSIVGDATGTTIERCISDATLKGQANIGGLIGISRGKCFLENCAYIGSIEGGATASALVGKNSQKISIKSCYSAPDVSGSSASTVNAFTDKISKVETNLNNHYLGNLSTANQEGEASVIYTPSAGSSKGTRLCYDLNKNGRNGVVWFMHEDIPYPFRGTDGNPIYGDNNGEVIITVVSRGGGELGHTHEYGEDHICSKCGYIEDGVNIDPLQNSGIDEMYAKGDVYVGLLRYTLDKNSKTATVKGAHKLAKTERDYVNAIHIPETIIYDGVEYTVKYIGEKSFNNSDMEYCYIPKTVNNIADGAFNGCTKLKYLHIADGPSAAPGSGPEAGVYMGHKDKTHELFEDCPLEKVYIGRNLRWYSDNSNPDEPFEDRNDITDVFFGPRVTRVGNANYSNAREGMSYDLFNDATGLERVYIMGDDQSLNGSDIEFWCRNDFSTAPTWYINRTIGHTTYLTYTTVIDEGFGCLDHCAEVTFGPFVKKVPKNMFGGITINGNGKLKKVDFTKAFNLEEIGDEVFTHCGDAEFGELDFSITKLKKIGVSAFQDCDHIRNITIPASTEEIGKDAFYGSFSSYLTIQDSDKPIKIGETAFRHDASSVPAIFLDTKVATIYQGRDIDKPEGTQIFGGWDDLGTLTIGSKVTKIERSTYEGFGTIGALSIMYNENPLELENNFTDVFNVSKGISSIFLDREMKHGDEHLFISKKAKETMIDLSIGYHQTSIYPASFKDATALKTIVIPTSVNTISQSSFEGCNSLENVFIASNEVTIEENAFKGCSALKNLYMTGKDLNLQKYSFAGCNNIKNVVVAFTKDPQNDNSSPEAFTESAYTSAYLSSLNEQSYDKINFTKEPWSLFQHRGSGYEVLDFDYTSEAQSGNYEHAVIKRDFKNEKVELINIPFEMDPYYFGSDVDIYSLPTEERHNDICYDGTCTNTLAEENVYKEDVTYFKKVDVKNSMTIPAGVYLVKTKRDIKNMSSHLNLFKSQLITVDNTEKEYIASHSGTVMEFGGLPKEIPAGQGFYVCDGGIIKLVTGDYTTSPCQVVMEEYLNDHYVKQMTYDLVDENSNVITTSKAALGFSKFLEGYTTFYDADNAYVAPKWCEVYVVTGANDGTIQLEAINDRIINKGQAVMIKSQKDVTEGLSEYLTYVTHDTTDPLYGKNLLKGVSVSTPANQLSPEHGFVYVLSCNSANTNTGFYKLSGEREMPAGKAYLDPSSIDSSLLSKACLFVFRDNTTGIQNANVGHDADENMYDLLGRKIKETGFKGIYILNNKKVIVK